MAKRSKTARARRTARAVAKGVRTKRNAKSNLGAMVEAIRNMQARGAGVGTTGGGVAAMASGMGGPNVMPAMGAALGGGSGGVAGTSSGLLGKAATVGKGGMLKNLGSSILGAMVLQRLMGLPGEAADRRLQGQAIRQQAEAITPENMYMQAALPQAQEEEGMARQALLSQLTGGVVGPQLARGEQRIGGR